MYQRKKKTNYSENYLGENMILDRLIVMDDVSGLADRFQIFLTFKKIRTDMHIHFAYFIYDKTTLANDIVTDKKF